MLKKITLIIIISIGIISISSGVFAKNEKASPIDNSILINLEIPVELEEIQEKIKPYIKISDDGIVNFDEAEAIKAGEEQKVIEVGKELNLFSNDMKLNPEEAIRSSKAGFPYWGNWCGPGKPIDALDAQCRTHDWCYGRRGYFACSCDNELRANIINNWSKMRSVARMKASAIFTFFTYSPCNPFA